MRVRKTGPGIFIAAAFIGPGTVTVCTLAGVSAGYDLLWVLLFALLGTINLQEMATRLGTIAGMGLGESMRFGLKNRWLKKMLLILIFIAIILGNAAYEAGNLRGAALGLEVFSFWKDISIDGLQFQPIPLLIGTLAIVLIVKGSFEVIKKVLFGAVILMSLSFLLSAIATKPSLMELLAGWKPKMPNSSSDLILAISLVGTTIVPYNLFLHASLSKSYWSGSNDLRSARKDTIISVLIGILISASVLVTAAFHQGQSIANAGDMAVGLEKVFGSMGAVIIGLGMFAAGLSSAITAPLAAGYVAAEIFDWGDSPQDNRFKWVANGIIGIGILFSTMDIRPVVLIQFAQAANGLLLPVIAILLLWVMNNKHIMKSNCNSTFQNIVGIVVVAITIILGTKALWALIY